MFRIDTFGRKIHCNFS